MQNVDSTDFYDFFSGMSTPITVRYPSCLRACTNTIPNDNPGPNANPNLHWYYLHQATILGICPSLCLSVTNFNLKKNSPDLYENFIRDVSVNKKELSKCWWKSPAIHPAIFNDPSTLRNTTFHHNTHSPYLSKNLLDLHENFTKRRRIFDKKVHVKFEVI